MPNHSLLDAVNQILLRVNVISGNANALTSLTDSTRQHNIDISVQITNEGIDELYTQSNTELIGEGAESTITLATGVREYALASDFIKLIWPLTDRTNTQYILPWAGTYQNFLLIDPQQLYTGLPYYGMISPITGKLRVERAPDATSNGKIYNYEYEKDLGLINATDIVPFNNQVFRAMVPAWVQLYKREMKNEFDQALYQQAIGRAARAMMEVNQREDYDCRG